MSLDPLVEKLPSLGVPAAAAAFAYSLLLLLSKSSILKNLVLDWLTSPNQAATLHSQFLIVRTTLFGATALSVRRNIAIGTVFLSLTLFLVVASFVDSSNPALGLSAFYAHLFAIMWVGMPTASAALLLLAFLLSHFVVYTFDAITFRLWRARRGLVTYALMLIPGYAVCFLIASFISALGLGFLANSNNGVLSAVWKAATAAPFVVPALIAMANELSTMTAERQESLGIALLVPWGNVIGGLGTFLLCMGAVLLSTGSYLVYLAGLLVLRLEYLIRCKYHYDQVDILDNPIAYIAMIAAVVVFAAVWLLQTGLGTLVGAL